MRTLPLLLILLTSPAWGQDAPDRWRDEVDLLKAENTILRQELGALRERLRQLEARLEALESAPAPAPSPPPQASPPADEPNAVRALRVDRVMRHKGTYSVDWHPSDGRVATGGGDGSVRIWSPAGAQLEMLEVAPKGACIARWSSDGKYLGVAQTYESEQVVVYDTARWRPLLQRAQPRLQPLLAWRPNSDRLAWALDHDDGKPETVVVSDERGSVKYSGMIGRAPWEPKALGWSDSGLLAVAYYETIEVLDPDRKRSLVRLDHSQPVRHLAWAPGRTTLASVSASLSVHTISIWNAEQGRLLRTWRTDERPERVSWSPDGKRLLIGGPGHATVLDADSGATVGRFELPTVEDFRDELVPASVLDLDWNPDGASFGVACNDDTVRVLRLP